MAVDANALTLAEWAENSNVPVVRKITESLYRTNLILKDIPLLTNEALEMRGKRITTLDQTIPWRSINELPVVLKGGLDDFAEQGWIVRPQFQVDVRLLNQPNNIQDPLDLQWRIFKNNFAPDFNFKFINNTHEAGDAKAFVGLRARLDNPTKYGTLAAMKIDAGGVDLSVTGVTKTTGLNFQVLLQQILDEMNQPEGNGVVFYVNSVTKRLWENSLKVVGPGAGFGSDPDAYGRTVSTYKNAKIRDVGRKQDQSTPVITSTETAAGLDGGTVLTSIYAVNYGLDSFAGWQDGPMRLQNLGKDPTNGVMVNAMMDWLFGIFQQDNRAVARLYNIKVA